MTISSSFADAQTERCTYDVFVSFRGEDTRNNFVDHLYAALDQAGIHTFKDDKLIRGKPISLELVKAIEESMIAVVVFSKNYGNSRWCLEELTKIIECWDLMGHKVLPVFYDVDPSDVRGLKGSLHAAFQQHEEKFIADMEKVKKWKEALVTAANLSGWDVSKTASGREAECIKQIVRNILIYSESFPAENLIGMESRIRHVKFLLGKGSGDDVCIIGIWGMGGIGKTTIARAVYHQISYAFEGSSFIEDVRENGSDKRGLKSLQEKLLSEILMVEHFKVSDCTDGICQIRRRLSRKKVLVVLDNVDNIKQLEFLAAAHDWFGPGSRIIVTTRDEHLLTYAQEKYVPELLNKTEAMKLFSRYAFKANIPPKEYENLTTVAVSHTGHLPLALKVLGSHFCGRNLDFWQSGLNVLAKIPDKEINGILKLSFNELNTLEKKIFLYVTCFYKGHDRRFATRVLDSCGFEAASGITVLIEKSLLTISKFGTLYIHDLIQEMGLCIVCECYPNTMLWIPEQIKDVMTTISRLETVEAIVETKNDVYRYSAKVFKRMKKLRLLQVRGRFISSELTYFPEELRWLYWSTYPFKSLRLARGMTNLVGLEMPVSNIKKLQFEKKVILANLKFMDLSFSLSLTRFPDVSEVPNLESLNLSWCSYLVEVHRSVLHHERIIHLDLSNCRSLKTLPPSIQMKSLQTLRLNGCENLQRFPTISREMERLLLLNIGGCNKILPDIRLLTGLIVFVSSSSYNMSPPPNKQCIHGSTHLTSLRILDLQGNKLVEDDFPSDVHNSWPSLEELDLSLNCMSKLPASISQLCNLKYLDLSFIFNLKELYQLPPLIQVLKAERCPSLEKIGDLSNKYKWLFQISLWGNTKLLKDHESQSHVANLLMKSFVQKCAALNHRLSIAVPRSKIPEWFSNQRSGNKITLNLPQNQITKIIGLTVCCLLCQSSEMPMHLRIQFKASGKGKLIDMPSLTKSADHVWIGYMSIDFIVNLCHGFEIEDLIISFDSDVHDVMECAVCVIYKHDIKGMAGTGSCSFDYDDVEKINHDSASSEDLKHGRWSLPTFSYNTSGGRKEVQVWV